MDPFHREEASPQPESSGCAWQLHVRHGTLAMVDGHAVELYIPELSAPRLDMPCLPGFERDLLRTKHTTADSTRERRQRDAIRALHVCLSHQSPPASR